MINKIKIIFKFLSSQMKSKSNKNKDKCTFQKIFRSSPTFKKAEFHHLNYQNQIHKILIKTMGLM